MKKVVWGDGLRKQCEKKGFHRTGTIEEIKRGIEKFIENEQRTTRVHQKFIFTR